MNKTAFKKQLLICILCIATVNAQAQQKIKDGTIPATPTLPAAGSLLELESNSAGLRMPQVALTNTTTWLPLTGSGAATTSRGMSVYNTNAGITSTNANYPVNGVGEYYWDGTGWVNKSSAITQNSLVLFSVKRTATQTFATASVWTLVDFTAEDYDKNSNYNLATNQFTVPANGGGYYQVNLLFATNVQAGNQGSYVALFVGGVFRRYITIANANGGAGIAATGSITLPLAAGNVVDVRYNGNTVNQVVNTIQVDVYQISR